MEVLDVIYMALQPFTYELAFEVVLKRERRSECGAFKWNLYTMCLSHFEIDSLIRNSYDSNL